MESWKFGKTLSNDSYSLTLTAFSLVVFVTSAVFWIFAWKTPIWLQDDLLFATRSGLPHGQTSIQALWDSLLLDLFERNSRSADFFAQLIFSTGIGVQIIMTLCFIIFSFTLASYFFKTIDSPEPSNYLKSIALVCGSTIPLAFTYFDASAFATYLFMSATVGYVLGFTWFLLVIILLQAPLSQQEIRLTPWKMALALLLATLVAFHHEVLAILQLVLVFVLVICTLSLKKLRSQGIHYSYWLTLVWASIVSVLRFTTGGMWKRTEHYEWAFLSPDMGFFKENLARLNYFLFYFLPHNKTLLMLLALAFSYFYFKGVSSKKLPKWMLYSNSVSILAMATGVFLASRLSAKLFTGVLDTEQYQQILFSRTGLLMAATVVLALILQVGNLLAAVINHGIVGVPISFALALTSFLVPVKLSFLSGRPLFFGIFFLVVSLINAMLFGLSNSAPQVHTRHFLRNSVAAILCATLIALSSYQVFTVAPQVSANQKAWNEISDQLKNCTNGEVHFPKSLPYRAIHSPFGDDGQNYLQHLRSFYALPKECVLRIK